MKVYVIPCVILFGLNTVLATIIACLSAFHLMTKDAHNAPIPQYEEWIHKVVILFLISVVWAIVSLVGIFVSMARRQIIVASVVLGFCVLILGVAGYFALTFSTQLELVDENAETLFHAVQKEIALNSPKLWIPKWLDNFQKQSMECCGIVSYYDYVNFWSHNPTKLPKSCCREVKSVIASCPEDITQISYPETPANFFKVETGCMDEINEDARAKIEESFYLTLLMTIFVGFGLIAFAGVYARRYFSGKSSQPATETNQDIPANVGDAEASAPIMIGDSEQMLESNEVFQPQQDPYQMLMVRKLNSYASRAQESGFNRANTVFAGLQQQMQSPGISISTGGSDMTVGGGNLGSREVFVVQDAPGGSGQIQTKLPVNEAGLHASGSFNDFAGDKIHMDLEPHQNKYDGHEKDKKKKGRKFDMYHHKNFK